MPKSILTEHNCEQVEDAVKKLENLLKRTQGVLSRMDGSPINSRYNDSLKKGLRKVNLWLTDLEKSSNDF